jgi:thiol:disulfide interchange protein DsbD
MFRLCLTFTLLLAPSAWAGKDFSSWRKYTEGRLISESASVAPGTTATVGLHVTLAEHWHTYWVNPGDSGAALSLVFKNSPGVKVKAVHMPVPERFLASTLISLAYSKEVVFPMEIEVSKDLAPGSAITIQADAEWLVCDEVCIPAIDTLRLDLPVTPIEEVRPSEHLGLMQKFLARIPVVAAQFPHFKSNGEEVSLTLEGWPAGREVVDFFTFRGSGVTNEKPVVEEGTGKLFLKFKKGNVTQADKDRVGVLISRDKTAGTVEAVQFGRPAWSFSEEGASRGGPSLWWMLLSAFIGGLILNLMPCVFPILSIKLLSILKISKQSAGRIRTQNLGYVSGVMLSFLAIALVLAGLRSAGHLVGWGFQLQSPMFLALLSWLFLLLTFNLAGWVDIDLLDAGAGGKLTRLGGFWGSFFTGVLAVVVASPCTAPFMGVAVGFGISQPTPVLMAVFLSLGFGLAFPYALMIVVPSALWFLPKPGPWMNTVKHIMAVPLALTIVWLLWVLYQVAGQTSLLLALVGGVLLAVFSLVSVPRGWSAYAEAINRFKKWPALFLLLTLASSINSAQESGGTMKLQGDWQPFSDRLIDDLKARGENVFIDMTADWCLTCKVNEKLIFSQPEVLAELKAHKVNLVVGDWTKRNEEITRFLTKYERVGVPFYLFFSARNPQGRVLPEVMTKSSFIEEIKKEFK